MKGNRSWYNILELASVFDCRAQENYGLDYIKEVMNTYIRSGAVTSDNVNAVYKLLCVKDKEFDKNKSHKRFEEFRDWVSFIETRGKSFHFAGSEEAASMISNLMQARVMSDGMGSGLMDLYEVPNNRISTKDSFPNEPAVYKEFRHIGIAKNKLHHQLNPNEILSMNSSSNSIQIDELYYSYVSDLEILSLFKTPSEVDQTISSHFLDDMVVFCGASEPIKCRNSNRWSGKATKLIEQAISSGHRNSIVFRYYAPAQYRTKTEPIKVFTDLGDKYKIAMNHLQHYTGI